MVIEVREKKKVTSTFDQGATLYLCLNALSKLNELFVDYGNPGCGFFRRGIQN